MSDVAVRERCPHDGSLGVYTVGGGQLGTAYSSNDSGDGPRCGTCNESLSETSNRTMCNTCYDKGMPFSSARCSLCQVIVGVKESKRASIQPNKLVAFNKYISSGATDAVLLRETHIQFRDLLRCPLRSIDPLCRGRHCAFREWERAHSRGDLKPGALRTRPTFTNAVGRPTVMEATKECHVCDKGEDSARMRMAGAKFESWELFFWTGEKCLIRTSKFTPETVVCNRCYMQWDNFRRKRQRESDSSANDDFRGTASYFEAAAAEDRRSSAILKSMDTVGADKEFLAKERIRAMFRARVLRDVFGGNKPVKLSSLSDVLRQMIEADPICQDFTILGGASSGRLLSRWVERALLVISETVPFWSRRETTATDGRLHPIMLMPKIVNRAQVASVVANMEEEKDARDERIRELEGIVAEAMASRQESEPDDTAVVRRAAILLKEAVKDYGKASSAYVRAQCSGEADLSFDDPRDEYEKNVPPLMVAFVNGLSHTRREDCDVEGVDTPLASRKCLIAGILTSFAHNTWFKYANVVGVFLKQKKAGRGAVDWIASHLRLCQTDNYVWRVLHKLSVRLSSEKAQKKLVPSNAQLVAASFDNVNLDANRFYGANGHVDLVAATAYFRVDESRGRDAVLPAGDTPLPLDFDRDFGTGDGRIASVWRTFEVDVADCAQNAEPQTSRAWKEAGDFEVRLAKRRIADAPADKGVGVSDRRVPSDVVMRYLGVEELGTKLLSDIMIYLDNLKKLLHVGEEGRYLALAMSPIRAGT